MFSLIHVLNLTDTYARFDAYAVYNGLVQGYTEELRIKYFIAAIHTCTCRCMCLTSGFYANIKQDA